MTRWPAYICIYMSNASDTSLGIYENWKTSVSLPAGPPCLYHHTEIWRPRFVKRCLTTLLRQYGKEGLDGAGHGRRGLERPGTQMRRSERLIRKVGMVRWTSEYPAPICISSRPHWLPPPRSSSSPSSHRLPSPFCGDARRRRQLSGNHVGQRNVHGALDGHAHSARVALKS